MKLKIFLNIFCIVFTLFFVQTTTAMDEKKLTSVQILNLSEIALKKLIKNKEIINLRRFINDARAILIFPEVYEGGLLFGAKGGNGLLIIRRNDGKFSKKCPFSVKDAPIIDYKNINLLKKYISDNGKIISSKITSVSFTKQKKLSREIKKAKILGLI